MRKPSVAIRIAMSIAALATYAAHSVQAQSGTVGFRDSTTDFPVRGRVLTGRERARVEETFGYDAAPPPAGSTLERLPDGTHVMRHSDGNLTIHHPDGTTRHVHRYTDGVLREHVVDGSGTRTVPVSSLTRRLLAAGGEAGSRQSSTPVAEDWQSVLAEALQQLAADSESEAQFTPGGSEPRADASPMEITSEPESVNVVERSWSGDDASQEDLGQAGSSLGSIDPVAAHGGAHPSDDRTETTLADGTRVTWNRTRGWMLVVKPDGTHLLVARDDSGYHGYEYRSGSSAQDVPVGGWLRRLAENGLRPADGEEQAGRQRADRVAGRPVEDWQSVLAEALQQRAAEWGGGTLTPGGADPQSGDGRGDGESEPADALAMEITSEPESVNVVEGSWSADDGSQGDLGSAGGSLGVIDPLAAHGGAHPGDDMARMTLSDGTRVACNRTRGWMLVIKPDGTRLLMARDGGGFLGYEYDEHGSSVQDVPVEGLLRRLAENGLRPADPAREDEAPARQRREDQVASKPASDWQAALAEALQQRAADSEPGTLITPGGADFQSGDGPGDGGSKLPADALAWEIVSAPESVNVVERSWSGGDPGPRDLGTPSDFEDTRTSTLLSAGELPGESDDVPPGDDVPGDSDDAPPVDDDVPDNGDDIPPVDDDVPDDGDDIPPGDDDPPDNGNGTPRAVLGTARDFGFFVAPEPRVERSLPLPDILTIESVNGVPALTGLAGVGEGSLHFESAGGTLRDQGQAGDAAWGRWEGGFDLFTVAGMGFEAATALGNQVHYAFTQEPTTDFSSLSGVATYLPVGNTLPTNESGDTGILNAFRLDVDFTRAELDYMVQATILGLTATGTAEEVTLKDALALGGFPLDVDCPDCGGAGASGKAAVTFSGSNADGVASTYFMTSDVDQTFTGAVVGAKQP